MRVEEKIKRYQEVFKYTDIKMTPWTIIGFTSDRVWIKHDNKTKILKRSSVEKAYGVIYGTRKH